MRGAGLALLGGALTSPRNCAARWLLVGALLAACADRVDAPSDGPGSASSGELRTGGMLLDRESVLGPFLTRHWVLPVPLQGPPPVGFSDAERSLSPEVCGACHAVQYAQWRTSVHAAAFSPGFAGQLIEGSLGTPDSIRDCQTCHAPLEEQQPFTAAGAPQTAHDPVLRRHGIVCAACHVRAHRHYGPPRRGDLPPLPESVPHGGFDERTEFRESRFCASCHQFFHDPGVNGKPVENTFAEWSASPQAAQGRACQECHMPDRAHSWRGVHDPEMVRTGVDVELLVEDANASTLSGALRLRNRDVGHAFPTYTTPRVFLELFQVDAEGREIPGTRVEGTIGREIDFSTDPWREIVDTRVFPGETVQLVYNLPRSREAEALVARAVVDPDYHYRGVFASLLETLQDLEARRLIEEATRRISTSTYVLAEMRRSLGAGG